MKTILRIILILLVASIVAAALSLAVNNNSTTSGSNISNSNQPGNQLAARPEGGDRDGGSLAGGFAGVLGTLAKLTGITILVVVIQKGFSRFGNRRSVSTQA